LSRKASLLVDIFVRESSYKKSSVKVVDRDRWMESMREHATSEIC
jgi:hypothetical protein